jgi:hypothetical protein
MRCVALRLLASAAISAAAVNGLRAQEMARSAYDTPIWKTIILGTYKNKNVLREALDSEHCGIEKVSGEIAKQTTLVVPLYYEEPTPPPFCHVDALADEIIGRPAFALSRTKSKVDLVVLSVSELGFRKRGASLNDIFARAQALGFELCRPEVGAELRLQYLDQPRGELLHIGMQPIATYDGDFVELEIEHGSWGLLLSGYNAGAVDVIYQSALFVFVKPRYGDSWN